MVVTLRAPILLFALMHSALALSAWDWTGSPSVPATRDLPSKLRACPNQGGIESDAAYGQYLLQIYREPEFEECLQILQAGRLVFSLTSQEFMIGRNFEEGASAPIGTLLTGNGEPDALVTEWTGGAHCCFVTHVFELGKSFREVVAVDAEDSSDAGFTDPRGDGHYVFVGNDWVFSYWRTSFLGSPAPRVSLSFVDGRLRLDLAAMKKPAPPPDEYAAMVERIKSDDEWDTVAGKDCYQHCGVPVALWGNMLEFIYTGHPDLAWRLVDDSWPPTQKGKRVFVGDFCRQLHRSHYWKELAREVGSCGGQAEHSG